MGRTAAIPAWAKPTPREIADCHWIAHACALEAGAASRYADIVYTLNWVTSDDATEAEAYQRLLADPAEGVRDTLAWLVGYNTIPPLALPRRNPDGATPTAEQLYSEATAGKDLLPEQRIAARDKAERDARHHRRLAAHVPH
jgi:hypothetical protein